MYACINHYADANELGNVVNKKSNFSKKLLAPKEVNIVSKVEKMCFD